MLTLPEFLNSSSTSGSSKKNFSKTDDDDDDDDDGVDVHNGYNDYSYKVYGKFLVIMSRKLERPIR